MEKFMDVFFGFAFAVIALMFAALVGNAGLWAGALVFVLLALCSGVFAIVATTF